MRTYNIIDDKGRGVPEWCFLHWPRFGDLDGFIIKSGYLYSSSSSKNRLIIFQSDNVGKRYLIYDYDDMILFLTTAKMDGDLTEWEAIPE